MNKKSVLYGTIIGLVIVVIVLYALLYIPSSYYKPVELVAYGMDNVTLYNSSVINSSTNKLVDIDVATNNTDVSYVNLVVDNKLVSSIYSLPYTYSLNVSQAPAGINHVEIMAYDNANELIYANAINLTIQNNG